MLYLLLGDDDFSKKNYIEGLGKKLKLPVEYMAEDTDANSLRQILSPSLFAQAKVFVLKDSASKLIDENNLASLKSSSQHIVFSEEKLDKRKSATQSLLKDKQIETKEFLTPTGQDLEKWLGERVKFLGGKISKAATSRLAEALKGESAEGSFAFKREAPKFNLWQADNELQKLLAYSNGKQIEGEDVDALVSQTNDTQAWDIVNALAEKNSARAYKLMESFFLIQDGSDEKSKAIQLNASLAEQFRSILLVRAFQESGIPDAQILERTGWKSGRLFIVKKLASKFEAKKVSSFLSKLVSFDEELKSTNTPARVLLELITAQIAL
jgi:DNA polymerase III delta subunit